MEMITNFHRRDTEQGHKKQFKAETSLSAPANIVFIILWE